MRIHILGICGTLMGSIALLARELGHEVSGSDRGVYPPMSDQLAAAGIELFDGYSAADIPADVDIVIVGNANLPRGNEAVEHVLTAGIPYTSGAEWLGRYLLADRWVIAIAGTHGKTTTTSMVAWILEDAGLSPGFLVGGIPGNFSSSSRLGDPPFFVIEADEYDTSYFDRRSKFLHYRPRTLVLNNLEYDHADIFPDLAAIQFQFHHLVRTVPANGQIIHPAEDDNLAQVLARGCWTPTVTFANRDGGTATVTAALASPDGSSFEVIVDGKPAGTVTWSMTGRHNVSNALAAIAAARHAGVPPGDACSALCRFAGVKRRMEPIYSSKKITVYDDFAHHPTAIRSTLEGLRAKVGKDSILAIVELGSHTMRRGTHADTLADATMAADEVIWFRPKGADWAAEDTLGRPGAKIMESIEEIVAGTISAANAGTRHIVVMSNSGFGGLREKLTTALRKSPDL